MALSATEMIAEELQGDNELAAEITSKLTELGLIGKINELRGTRLEIVAKTFGGLWKINKLGLKIEENDKNIVGDAKIDREPDHTRVKEEVRTKLGEIGHSHHYLNDWFDNSVVSLINAATTQHPDGLLDLKNDVADFPARYIYSIDSSGQAYKRFGTEISWAEGSGAIEHYLDSNRPADVKAMRGFLNDTVLPEVGRLQVSKFDDE